MIPQIGDRIDYVGKSRQVIGRLSYSKPPEPGAIVGPNGWGEQCVVLGRVKPRLGRWLWRTLGGSYDDVPTRPSDRTDRPADHARTDR